MPTSVPPELVEAARTGHLLFVILANPESVAPPGAKPPASAYTLQFGQTTGLGAVRWMR
jgi:hypothetical protein